MKAIRQENRIRAAVFTAIFLFASPTIAQDDLDWTTSVSGGSEIELPVFMTEGWVRALMTDGEDFGTAFEPELYPVQLRQYRTDAQGRPAFFLENTLGASADEVTYRFDRDALGAISGYTRNATEIFYGMCKKDRVGTIVCFDVHWPREMQPMMAPIVERVAASFKV